MINLQFHHNNVTCKNCLKFLGIVIEIQIKAMLRHNFPFEKSAGCFIYKLQHKTPIKNSKREKFFSVIKVLNINMKLEAQLRRKSISSLYQPAAGNKLAYRKLDWITRRKSIFFCLYLWIFTHRALQGTTGATYRPHVYASQAKFYLQTRARYFRLEVCSMAAHLETSDLFREIKFTWVIILVRDFQAV